MINTLTTGHYVAFLLLLTTILLNVNIDTGLRVFSHDAGGSERRVLLLTAHPDDECMFFGPTLLALTDEQGRVEGTQIYSMCLSSVDTDGRGSWRKDELAASLDVFGVAPERRVVLDEPFKDNITHLWNEELVAHHVLPYVIEHNIDVILTFDEHGISSHPNHISLYRGIRTFLRMIKNRHHIKAYALKTVSTAPKYTSFGYALVAHLERAICGTLVHSKDFMRWNAKININTNAGFPDCSKYGSESVSIPVFVSDWERYFTTLQAMRQHKSQLVWFRYLYVVFSQYMWLNEWEEIVV